MGTTFALFDNFVKITKKIMIFLLAYIQHGKLMFEVAKP